MVPLKPYWEMLIVPVKLVWIDCIGSNVLIVHLAGWEAHTSGTVSKLQLFSIDTANMSASFITSLAISHGIAGIDPRGRHLAVIGYGNVCVSHIRSFEVEFGHISSVTAIATIRVMTPDVLRCDGV
ncbi:hypothetical protein DFH09DRAFT_1304171 [Mycena vulgaris]|nr:hypothetical protein DFH09DRAFT_1304171 [Mycena vulgaris]